jgi:hypothetical protein
LDAILDPEEDLVCEDVIPLTVFAGSDSEDDDIYVDDEPPPIQMTVVTSDTEDEDILYSNFDRIELAPPVPESDAENEESADTDYSMDMVRTVISPNLMEALGGHSSNDVVMERFDRMARSDSDSLVSDDNGEGVPTWVVDSGAESGSGAAFEWGRDPRTGEFTAESFCGFKDDWLE